MKKYFLVILVLFLTNQSISQSWSFVHKFTENLIGTVSFKDSLNGYAVSLAPVGVVFKTTDRGVSWKKITIGAVESPISKFVYVERIAIGIGNYHTFIKSTDNGETWELKDLNFTDICAADGVLFAGTNNGELYKSEDFGDHWLYMGNPSVSFKAIAFFNKLEGICATNSGSINYTSDGGNSWTAKSTPTTFSALRVISKTSAIGIGNSKICLTTDQGRNWSTINYDFRVDKIENAGNGTLIVSGGNNILKSTDYGKSWGIEHFQASITSISCINENLFYLISDYTLYKTINGALTAPSLISPRNETKNIPLTVQLQWESGSVASLFHVQCALDSNFSNSFLDTIIPVTSLSLRNIALNQKYFWRVKDYIINKTPPWSDVFNFTTTEGKPILIAPENANIDTPIPVVFKYRDVSEVPEFYHIQISTDSYFFNMISDSSGIKTDSIIVPELSNDKTYYWRMRIKAGTKFSPWSDVWSLTTISKTPRLEKPSNGSEVNVRNITFHWSFTDSFSEYRIQISRDSTFNIVDIDTAHLASNSINLSVKLTDKYYWRVCAKSLDNNFYWSNIWYFKIEQVIDFPLAIGTKWYYQAISFTRITAWEQPTVESKKHYGVVKEVISILPNEFRKIAVTNCYRDSIKTDVEYQGFIDGKYIISSDPNSVIGDIGYYNSAFKKDSCWLMYCLVQSPYEIFGFVDSAQIWQLNDGYIKIHKVIMPNIGLIYSDYISLPRRLGRTDADTLQLIGLLSGGVLYGDTLYNVVGVKEDKYIPVNYNLYQNYPNPFNPTTTIEYSTPSLSYVKLKVYDILGREVATLVNEEKPAGKYKVTFNGSGLTSGVYFCNMEAGGYVNTKKIILIK